MPRSSRRKIAGSLVAAVASLSLWGASAAGAATVTVGSPITAPQDGGTSGNNGSSWTAANFALAEPGTHVTSPVNGTIISWRAVTGGTGPYALRVLRPAGGGTYTGEGTSTASVDSEGDHTFAANLPIQAGDLIGIDLPNNQGLAGANREGALWGGFIVDPADSNGTLPDGFTAAPNPIFNQTGGELAFNAVVQYPDPLTTKAKCKKKKHKRSAESAKKKKCKKHKKHG